MLIMESMDVELAYQTVQERTDRKKQATNTNATREEREGSVSKHGQANARQVETDSMWVERGNQQEN